MHAGARHQAAAGRERAKYSVGVCGAAESGARELFMCVCVYVYVPGSVRECHGILCSVIHNICLLVVRAFVNCAVPRQNVLDER